MLTINLGGGEQSLAEHYASVFAAHLGYVHRFGHVYDDRRQLSGPERGHRYARAVYGFPVNVKVFLPQQMFDLYLDADVLSGEPRIHCRMEGERWSDDDLFGLCQSVNGLPHGLEAAQVLIDKAAWLDENPEYRGLPGLAKRHDDKRADRSYVEPPKRPRDW